MERRPGLTVLAALLAALVLLAARPAAAQNKAAEAAARALQKKAMDEDYLNVDLDKATDHLNQAIAKCGADKCSANLRALLRRDLATVFSAANKKDEALATMVDALRNDPNIQLDPNFRTKEIETIFAAAKKPGGGAAPTSGAPPAAAAPAGDFTHTPFSEQAVRTPLPIYTEYGGSEAVTKVVVKYKSFGMTEFKTLELKKLGPGWGANIPCADIQQGDVSYYLQGFNSNNDPVATGGDRNNPYKTSITKTISGPAPHLPGQVAPSQCAETGDCPPDFPGCNKKVNGDSDNLKGEGEDCEEDAQCKSGTCKSDKCTAPPEEPEAPGAAPKLRRFWVGASLSVDLQVLPSSKNVCTLNQSSGSEGGKPLDGNYYCIDSQNHSYPANTNAGEGVAQTKAILTGANQDDQVNGGLLPANFRILASFDYALNYNLLVGARLGYTAMTFPGSSYSAFPPLHLEARVTYVVGHEALASKGVFPQFFLGLGAAQFSSNVGVTAFECDASGNANMPLPNNVNSSSTGCTGGAARTAHAANAWRIDGPVFVAPGLGLRFGLSDRVALGVNAKFALAFGNGFLFAPTPEAAFQVGF